jgi:hypothetical protein
MSRPNRSWVEVAEKNWTEAIRAHTRSVSLEGAKRNAAGNVIADLDLADGEPLPAEVAAVALVRRTHAQQQAMGVFEDLTAAPLECQAGTTAADRHHGPILRFGAVGHRGVTVSGDT